VNPLLVFGPPLTSQLNASQANIITKILMGETKTYFTGGVGLTDVRDVAEAHILALESPLAVGRRLISLSAAVSWKEIAREMKRQFPEYPVSVDDVKEEITWTMDTKPLEALGKKEFISLEKMIKDTVEAFIKVGAVPDLRKQ
jgi:nucleoside-diphosphate-sugar epimerase